MADHGPPYSEDEDLQSPVVKSSRNRKNKSTAAHLSSGSKRRAGPSERGSHLAMAQNGVQDRGLYTGTRSDGSEIYYFDSAPEQIANGPGGEFVTYPPSQSRRSLMATGEDGRRDSHFAAILPSRSYVSHNGTQDPVDDSDSDISDLASPPPHLEDDSRMSRDYQFSIASPDEEMHGKAVALFDFTRENENELPLTEGQVIWVSYRHGQGWLVAEDPKTRESGLVPEEYVRLLRDIEGGWGGLAAADEEGMMSPVSVRDPSTPTQPNHPDSSDSDSRPDSNGQNHRPPVVSSFSTSSKDLDPYPPHLLTSEKPGQPPLVTHYQGQRGGSQANTPTQASAGSEAFSRRRGSEDSR